MKDNLPPIHYYTNDLIEYCRDQREVWPLYDKNIGLCLEAIRNQREFILDKTEWGITVKVLNYRKASATADVEKALKGERACFLCAENRPVEQFSLKWENYEILLNPYPLMTEHLTIVATDHRPQLICESIRDMARLTRILPESMLFYNGPRCGASAPDHFHFQAVTDVANLDFATRWFVLPTLFKIGKSEVRTALRYHAPYPYFHILSAKDSDLIPIFRRIMKALPAADPEPMVNILAWKAPRGTSVVVVPRKAHRPECYGEGENQILVSPASLEMAGIFTAVSECDAERITEPMVERIYDDVCLTNEEMEEIMERI